jgi:Protein of unknown function (DUF2785)
MSRKSKAVPLLALLALTGAASATPPPASTSEQARGLTPAALCPPAPWSRAELVALRNSEFVLPESEKRNQLALGLLSCLGDPDPELRDGVAFTGLSHWLRAKELDAATQLALAERLLAMLGKEMDPAGFERPFAALVLSEVARADRIEPVLPEPLLRAVTDRTVAFLETVTDYRGFDPREGWRHSVAHGADLVLQLGVNPRVAAAGQRALLEALARQIAPAEVFYHFGEPERLARAVFFVHQRGDLDQKFWDEWFARRGDAAPLASWGASYESLQGLARRHDTVAFLQAVAFAARSNRSPQSEKLAALADRELTRIHSE